MGNDREDDSLVYAAHITTQMVEVKIFNSTQKKNMLNTCPKMVSFPKIIKRYEDNRGTKLKIGE